MMFPLDRLRLEHRRHYREGTLADFAAWFQCSGFGDMLDNPYLSAGPARQRYFKDTAPDFSNMKRVRYQNAGREDGELIMRVHIDRGTEDMRGLFENFVRCTAHTHLFGDFRKHYDFFARSYTGPRFVLFDGSGTCLLLGAMFQSLAKRLHNEDVALHYSHTSKRELTHVFASWDGNFVDPDQKTWVPMSEIDDASVFGYLFQQLGVSAYQVFLAIPAMKRARLFSCMSRDYFEFYDASRSQYMYHRDQSIRTVSDYFKQARAQHCSNLDIYATDFTWKADFRARTEALGIRAPYFLAALDRPVRVPVPFGGSFEIGLHPDLPLEAEQLASIFLGRVPGAVKAPVTSGRTRVTVPELPWMLVFDAHVDVVRVNRQAFKPWLSECGRHRILGAGEIERVTGTMSGADAFELVIETAGDHCAVVFPINAFALSSGLVDISTGNSHFEICGQAAQ